MSVTLSSPRSYSDRVLLTIHGIGSENKGLANVRTACEKRLPGLKCDSYYYGKKWPIRDVDADEIFQHVRERIELVYLKHIIKEGRRLFIVAHSFGTLAVIRALEMHIPGVSIEGLVLLGSIVPCNYRWDGLIENRVLKHPPLVVVRPLDRFVRFAKTVGGRGGASGARGCIATGMYRPLETYKNGGHTSYYPADCDDIVNVIVDGISSVQLVSYDEWLKSCGFWSRLTRLPQFTLLLPEFLPQATG
jgi:pimeloyl-ACP methyl ester carboxylesterase